MGDDWRTISLFGREMFRLDWLDFLGIGMLVFAMTAASVLVTLK